MIARAQRDLDLAFHRGMLAALAVVAEHDQEVLYREIVETAGINNLKRALESYEDAEWTGLVRYRYSRRRGRAPRRVSR